MILFPIYNTEDQFTGQCLLNVLLSFIGGLILIILFHSAAGMIRKTHYFKRKLNYAIYSVKEGKKEKMMHIKKISLILTMILSSSVMASCPSAKTMEKALIEVLPRNSEASAALLKILNNPKIMTERDIYRAPIDTKILKIPPLTLHEESSGIQTKCEYIAQNTGELIVDLIVIK